MDGPNIISECGDPCAPQCPSVFDRVVVSYLIRGGTLLTWELLPTFTDEGPLEFQLQYGTTDNNDSDDWIDVGLPVENVYFAYDGEQRVFGKTNWAFYRVKLTSSIGVYYSDPANANGTLERRSWRLAREMVRQRKKAYRVGVGAQEGYLLKRRWTGVPCPVCLDYMTREVRNPDCPQCYGTGFKCGYFYPMACVFAEMDPRTYHLTIEDQQRGVIKDVAIRAEMLMADMVSEQDVWVAKKTDDRYFVHEIQNTAEIRGTPLVAKVVLRLIPYSSILYTINIPQQLQYLGFT
jgi:hypothetical protein